MIILIIIVFSNSSMSIYSLLQDPWVQRIRLLTYDITFNSPALLCDLQNSVPFHLTMFCVAVQSSSLKEG